MGLVSSRQDQLRRDMLNTWGRYRNEASTGSITWQVQQGGLLRRVHLSVVGSAACATAKVPAGRAFAVSGAMLWAAWMGLELNCCSLACATARVRAGTRFAVPQAAQVNDSSVTCADCSVPLPGDPRGRACNPGNVCSLPKQSSQNWCRTVAGGMLCAALFEFLAHMDDFVVGSPRQEQIQLVAAIARAHTNLADHFLAAKAPFLCCMGECLFLGC
eukprot:s1504_g6.t1